MKLCNSKKTCPMLKKAKEGNNFCMKYNRKLDTTENGAVIKAIKKCEYDYQRKK